VSAVTAPTAVTVTSAEEAAMPAARLDDLIPSFEKRRSGRVDAGPAVPENLADLAAAGVAAPADDGERRRVLRTVAGGCGATAFALAATAAAPPPAAVLDHAAIQLGLAQRAYAVAVARVAQAPGQAALLPGAQFAVAGMRGACDTMTALLERQAALTADNRDAAAALAAACVAAMYVSETADRVLCTAAGLLAEDPQGTGRLAQLRHDLRAVPPPVPEARCRELVGKALLGIDPDATPRWV